MEIALLSSPKTILTRNATGGNHTLQRLEKRAFPREAVLNGPLRQKKELGVKQGKMADFLRANGRELEHPT